MTDVRQGRFRLAMMCGLIVTVLFALAACGGTAKTSSTTKTTAKSTATPIPTATIVPVATVVLANKRAEWTSLGNLPTGADLFSFAPSDPRVGLICTSMGALSATNQPQLYQTHDGGQTWGEVLSVPALQLTTTLAYPPLADCKAFIDAADALDNFVQKVAIDPQGAGHAIARALYRSRDGGATWGPALGTLDRTDGFDQLAIVGSKLIATAHLSFYGASGCSAASPPLPAEQPSTVLYTSDDAGQTWQPIGQQIEDQHLKVVGMSLMDTTIFARA